MRNHYIVKESTAPANVLTKLKIEENHRKITFDIKDLYGNIPKQETHWIAKILLLENNNEHKQTNYNTHWSHPPTEIFFIL